MVEHTEMVEERTVKFDRRHILGTITIAVITGGTIYAIVKHKQRMKQEEMAIDIDQARADVNERKVVDFSNMKSSRTVYPETTYKPEEDPLEGFTTDEDGEVDMDALKDDIHEEVDYNRSFNVAYDPTDMRERVLSDVESARKVKEYLTTPISMNEDDGFEEGPVKEDNILRYEPDSMNAIQQFQNMELAEWRKDDVARQILVKLYNVPFRPKNDGDKELLEHLEDNRYQFFGRSHWVRDISIADLILYYARNTQYNLDESVLFWAELFLEHLGINNSTSTENLMSIAEALDFHVFYNERSDTYGLFGLEKDQFNNAARIAQMNIDRSLTYHIEHNEFLKNAL